MKNRLSTIVAWTGICVVVLLIAVVLTAVTNGNPRYKTEVAAWSRGEVIVEMRFHEKSGQMKAEVMRTVDDSMAFPWVAQNSHGLPTVIRTPGGYVYATGSVDESEYAERYGAWVVRPESVYATGEVEMLYDSPHDVVGPQFDYVDDITTENVDPRTCVRNKYRVLACDGSGRVLYRARRDGLTYIVFGREIFGPYDGLVSSPKIVEVGGEKTAQFYFAKHGRKDRYFRVTGGEKELLPWPER